MRYYLINVVIAGLWLSLAGCSDSKSPVTVVHNSREFKKSHELKEAGLLSFSLDEFTAFKHYSISFSEIDSSGYYSLANAADNSIIIYRVGNKDIVKKIKLDVEGPNGVGKLDLVYHLIPSLDSILIYSLNYGKMYLVNAEGKVVDTFTVMDFKNNVASDAFPEPSRLSPIMKKGTKIFFSCGLQQRLTDYSDYETVLSYDLKDRSTHYIFPLPQIYSTAYWGSPFKYIPTVVPAVSTDHLMISCPVDENVYEITLDGKLINTFPATSQFIEPLAPMKDDVKFGIENDVNDYYDEEKTYSLSSSDFASLKFDRTNNVYYRLAFIRPSKDSVRMGIITPHFSLSIFNKDMVKIGEKWFNGRNFDTSMHFVYEGKYYIARKDLYASDENQISFSRFSLIEL